MNISEGFIKRPIATSLLMAAIAMFGLVAYRALPVSDLPNVDFPTLLVTAQLPGASPETMASSVATPLENQFSMIAGLESMTSVNSLGSTQVTLEFDLNRNLDGAAVDVQAAITQAARLLPQGMPTPPTFTKVNPADQPVLYLVITSTTMPPWTLDEYAETRIAQRISMVSGVAQVQVLGSQKYAVHAQLDPHALASRQIGINEVETAVRNWNVNSPTGTIVGPHKAFTLQASGQLMNADQFKAMVVTYRNGAPVRLEDLGSVLDGVEDPRTASWFYTHDTKQRAITLGIQRQPGTNTIAVADAVKALLPQFQAELPASVHMDVLYDRSDTIRESYRDVQVTMALTLALVILVIFVFLRNVRATIIPSLALPFSIIGTFAIMYALNYSLDNLSMMALILSVGFVVDDAIVMLENIYRHVEMGEEPMAASLVGSREIGFTIISMTLSLAAVFIPVLFMGGVLGRLFREFSVTICVAILISGIVSITLTPMLCSRFLKKPSGHGEGGRFRAASERVFNGLLNFYDRTLQVVLQHRGATVVAAAVVLAATALLFIISPKGFIPDQDTDQIAVTTEAAQGTTYDKLVEYQGQVAEIIRQDPNVAALVSTVGGSAAQTLGGPNLGQLVVHLKPRSQRHELADDIIERLRPELANVPGMKVYLQNPPTVRIGGQVSKSLYQYAMQSPNRQQLYEAARNLEKALRQEPGLVDLTSDLEVTSPQVNVEIDRDKAAALGVTANTIESAFLRCLRTTLGLDDLRTGERVQGAVGAGAAVPGRSLGVVTALLQVPRHRGESIEWVGHDGDLRRVAGRVEWRAGTARHPGSRHRDHRSPDREPLRPALSGDDFVRAGARRVARHDPDPGRRSGESHPAGRGERSVPGCRQGVREFARQSGGAVDHRDHGRLHRAGDPLRELHPPADDPLGAAVGRLRRPGDAADLPHGSEHLCVRRDDHADRDRREERDHADRLRARGGAQRQVTAAGDLRRVPGPVPADHDDDDGGAARGGADCARLRRRRRGQAAARSGGGGRPDVLAAGDPVSHPGGLYLHGPVPGLAAAGPSRGAGGRWDRDRRKLIGLGIQNSEFGIQNSQPGIATLS